MPYTGPVQLVRGPTVGTIQFYGFSLEFAFIDIPGEDDGSETLEKLAEALDDCGFTSQSARVVAVLANLRDRKAEAMPEDL